MSGHVLRTTILLGPILGAACGPVPAGRGAQDDPPAPRDAGRAATGGAGGASGAGGAPGAGGDGGSGGAGGRAAAADMAVANAPAATADAGAPPPPPPRPPADAAPAAAADLAPAVRVSLPFAVDEVFIPSGHMGDGEVAGGITDAMCPQRAAPNAPGVCHSFTWTPGAKGWGGVWWQYPLNNWGMQPGLAIAPGAKEIRFWAWGATGTEKITFFTGYRMTDGFNAEMKDIVLKTTPTAYTLSLTGKTYDRVAGGFGWVAGGSMVPVKFSVDGIEWR